MVERASPSTQHLAQPRCVRALRLRIRLEVGDHTLPSPVAHLLLEGLADEPHNVRQILLRAKPHFYVTVAPTAEIRHVFAQAARVMQLVEWQVEREARPTSAFPSSRPNLAQRRCSR